MDRLDRDRKLYLAIDERTRDKIFTKAAVKMIVEGRATAELCRPNQNPGGRRMARVNDHSEIVRRLMREHLRVDQSTQSPGVDVVVVEDPRSDHYVLLNMGWQPGEKRVDKVVRHVRIKDGRMWVEEDWTEDGIAAELVEAGVPASVIV